VQWVGPGEAPPPADLIILPGSKSVAADLAWLRAQGWEAALQRHLRYGGKLIGICGGYQMLGTALHDPDGIEGPPGSQAGLGLLELETRLEPEKRLTRVAGRLLLPGAPAVSGYEIHQGVTAGPALVRPAARLDDGTSDGALSADGQILGTYLHGLFEEPAACAALLQWAGLEHPETPDYRALREAAIERLADAAEEHLDLARLFRAAGITLPAG